MLHSFFFVSDGIKACPEGQAQMRYTRGETFSYAGGTSKFELLSKSMV